MGIFKEVFMKLINLIGLITALALFTGCGADDASAENLTGGINSKNAVEKYNNAIDSFFKSDSYTISGNTEINMTEEGKESVNMGMSMTTELKTKNDENGNKTAELETLFELADVTENGGGYYKDGYFYPKAVNQKIKTDYEGIFSEGNIIILKLTENVLNQGTEPAVKKVEEGYRVDFDLNVDVLRREIPDFITNISDYLRVSEYDFTLDSCQIIAIIGDDGGLKSETVVSKAKVNLYDGTSEKDFRSFKVECDMEITENISQVNDTEVVLPDNLNDYIDVTPREATEKSSE